MLSSTVLGAAGPASSVPTQTAAPQLGRQSPELREIWAAAVALGT